MELIFFYDKKLVKNVNNILKDDEYKYIIKIVRKSSNFPNFKQEGYFLYVRSSQDKIENLGLQLQYIGAEKLIGDKEQILIHIMRPVIGRQGWKQFQTNKQEMLYQYDLAKIYSESHIVRTSHGFVAEAIFRKWLSEFLPMRYGVCSGYIVSQNMLDEYEEAVYPHYDVIIYDKLNSPILWIEENPDDSFRGKKRGIPAEYVNAVIEIKSSLTSNTSKRAIEKLEELRKLEELSLEIKKFHREDGLPNNFFMATVFFELKSDDYSDSTLTNLIPKKELRGYIGGLILKGENLDLNQSGRFKIFSRDIDVNTNIGKTGKSLGSPVISSSIIQDGKCVYNFLDWSSSNFSYFAFELFYRLNDMYHDHWPSYYGLSWIKETPEELIEKYNKIKIDAVEHLKKINGVDPSEKEIEDYMKRCEAKEFINRNKGIDPTTKEIEDYIETN